MAENWAKYVEAIAQTQHELKQVLPKTARPTRSSNPSPHRTRLSRLPARLQPLGWIRQLLARKALIMKHKTCKAAGDEAGCMKPVAKARSLARLK